MGLLTKDKKIKLIPQTEESKKGSAYLQNLLSSGTPNIPQQQIANLTPVEQAIMEYLPQFLESTGQSADMARQLYGDIIEGTAYDKQAAQLKKDYEWATKGGINTLRQRANLSGMMDSTNAAAQEGEYLTQSQSVLVNELNKLFEQDIQKKLTAAQGLQGTEAQHISNVAAIGGLAEKERVIEQARNDALYEQLITQILFPYEKQADIANALLNYKQDYAVTGGGMTDFGFGLTLAANAAGS